MQDVIFREITVKASKERVYRAITDPAEITRWFPDSIEEGSLEVGQRPIFVFEGGGHKARTYVEAANPFSYFAFRWVPGISTVIEDVLSVANTLVEFHIEAIEGGTRVSVKESGFASLPPEVAEQCLNENSGGWDYMMDRLEKEMNQN